MVTNLTEGKVNSVLWKFTLPMFISVVFQQLYNIADSAIAGRFAGEDALAAVGASYPITMIFMAIAIGCNVGCAVSCASYVAPFLSVPAWASRRARCAPP